MITKTDTFFLLGLFISCQTIGQTILLDDFTRADDPVVGNSWTESETASTGAQIFSNYLLTGSTTSGREWVYRDISSNYATNGIGSNTSTLTWAFNFRTTRTDPSGFDSGQYGLAFCLGSTSSDFTLGNGYAVVIGQTGSSDPIRLARFTGGMDLSSNFTNIISGGDYGSEYISVRVTYQPSTNNWSLYAESSASAFPQSDPTTTATQIGATTSNNTYTSGNDLRYVGCLWNHASSGTENTRFDDVYCPSVTVCAPPGAQATTFSATNIGSSTMDVNWVRGTGDNVLVLARSGSAVNAGPSSGAAYTANTIFGSGDQIGTGNYVVYNGPGTSVSVTGLSASTTYHYAIFEYNDMDLCYLAPGLTGSAATSAPTPFYFRSKESGVWTMASTWESSANGTNWSDATAPPNPSLDLTITIRSPHEVNIPDDATVDQVVVDEGGTLTLDNTTRLTISNGTGVDLDINGTFHDNATSANTAVFNASAKWRLGANGLFLKTNDSGSSVYRDNYEGGISTIPATANWTVRDIYLTLPSVSGMTYPNLTLENNTGADITMGFSGSSGFPTIKGNFDVGGAGADNVRFDNLNTNATPCLIQGNLIVKSGCLLDNTDGVATDGGGFEVQGNITANGDIYLASGTGTTKGILRFTGGNAQTVSGAGFIDINNLTVNKTANQVTLDNITEEVWVYNQLTLTNRNIVLNDEFLELISPGTLSGGSSTSYIQTNGTGSFWREVTSSATSFPVGNSTYNPIVLTNTGAADYFYVRVIDDVFSDGTTGNVLTSDVVDRTWMVNEETAGGSNVSMTVQWNAIDELTSFNRSLCYISRYTGTGWNSATEANAGGAGPYTRTRSGFTEFSPFAVGSNGVLPIELLDFKALAQKQEVLLSWQTKTERNNRLFAIERSPDGHRFSEIGQVPGNGTSAEPHDYRFTDASPYKGANYYRLRQVDTDGRQTCSPVVNVIWEDSAELLLSPMPATDQIQVQLGQASEETTSWQLFDPVGRTVLSGSQQEGASAFSLDISMLDRGTYTLQVQIGMKIYTKSVIKR